MAEKHVLAAQARVEPDPELLRLIEGLANAKTARSVRRGAINAAGGVVAQYARQSTLFRSRSGQLKDSIRVRTKVAGEDVQGFVMAGSRYTVYRRGRATKQNYKNADGSYNAAFYAAFVEKGTKPHYIPKTKVFGTVVAFGGRVMRQVRHPGSRATRFMEVALARAEARIGPAIDDYMLRRLRRLQDKGKAG